MYLLILALLPFVNIVIVLLICNNIIITIIKNDVVVGWSKTPFSTRFVFAYLTLMLWNCLCISGGLFFQCKRDFLISKSHQIMLYFFTAIISVSLFVLCLLSVDFCCLFCFLQTMIIFKVPCNKIIVLIDRSLWILGWLKFHFHITSTYRAPQIAPIFFFFFFVFFLLLLFVGQYPLHRLQY